MTDDAKYQYGQSTAHPLDARVRIVGAAEGLQAIHCPGVKAVIWQRQRRPDDLALIRAASAERLTSLTYAFARAANPDSDPLVALFRKDVTALAAIYNALASEPIEVCDNDILITEHYYDVALNPDADWQEYHADRGYKLRLISAFAGRGTEWIAGDVSYRDLLRLNKHYLTEDAWEPQRHQYTGTGDVLVLKGDGYKGCAMAEKSWSHEWLVHREPLPQPGVPRKAIIMPFC